MLKNSTKRNQGFTLIEVLIVLAIAGLIMLIVFLAVPALQRNARDTSRKNDVARILGAAQEVIDNNNGDITKLTTAKLQAAVGNLAYYPSAGVTVAAGTATGTKGANYDAVVIYTGAKCSDPETEIAGNARQLVGLYFIESGGGTSQCTAS